MDLCLHRREYLGAGGVGVMVMNQPVTLPKLPPRPHGDTMQAAVYDIADALQYPVDHRGRVYDVRFMLPALAYHLARAGCIVDPNRAVIKPRRLPPTPGVIEDAVEWVALDAPDSIDDELAGATLDDLDSLSPAARAELLRRLGADNAAATNNDLDGRAPWRVETSIQFDDEENK